MGPAERQEQIDTQQDAVAEYRICATFFCEHCDANVAVHDPGLVMACLQGASVKIEHEQCGETIALNAAKDSPRIRVGVNGKGNRHQRRAEASKNMRRTASGLLVPR